MTVEVIFSHSGSMFAYYLGIAEVLQKYDLSDVVFSGTSGGCFPCILLNSKNNIREFFEDILNCVKTSKDSWENVIRDFLTEYLSEDDIEANKGKFTCKLTKLNDFFLPEKVKVSKWTDKQDFVDCIVASCYVPIMCGNKFYIEYRDQKIVDGFFSGASNEPVTENKHILLSPSKWRYVNPSWLLPSKDTVWLKSLYELGYNDALANIKDISSVLKPNKEKDLETQNDPVRQSE